MQEAGRVVRIAALLTILFSLFRYGSSVICYQCNSQFDPRCDDPFDPYSLGSVNCSFQQRLEHLSLYEPVVCRKTTQIVQGQRRVVRGCGVLADPHADDQACLRRSGTHDVRMLYCSCTGDLCNTGAVNHPFLGSLAISLTALLIALKAM